MHPLHSVQMTGQKVYTKKIVRDRHLLCIPSLAFLDYYAPIVADVLVECGIWDTFRLFPIEYHDGSG